MCLLGSFSVGKTSLVRRFVYDMFDDKYIGTIGVKVSRKQVLVQHGSGQVQLNMLLWDMADSDEFVQIRPSYERGSAGAVLVCDLTRPETLHCLRSLATEFLSACPHACLIVAANKCDLVDERGLTQEQVVEMAASLHAPYCLTSAKTGQGVEDLFQHLGRLTLTRQQGVTHGLA
jgi:small GTP-binding protein